MSNGDTIKQVRDLLENPKGLGGKVATILTLTLLAETYEKLEAAIVKLEEIHPFVKNQMDEKKTQKESSVHYQRVVVGAILTNLVVLALHMLKIIP